jgi:hypothetical protein
MRASLPGRRRPVDYVEGKDVDVYVDVYVDVDVDVYVDATPGPTLSTQLLRSSYAAPE